MLTELELPGYELAIVAEGPNGGLELMYVGLDGFVFMVGGSLAFVLGVLADMRGATCTP